MAETIKGINVVIGAETTALTAALTDVNKKSRNIQSELKEVEKLLKLDPTNTELLAQKQKLLGDAVGNTSDKLNQLKAAQKQVSDQFARGDISEGQYRAFQREVAKAEQELSGLQTKLKYTGPDFDKLGKSAEDASSKIKASGEKISGIGEKLSVGITAPVVGIAALATEGTEEFRKSMARLEVNANTAGASLDTVKEALKDVSAISGETDSSVEALSNVLAAGFKGDEFKQVLDELSGAAIKFSDTLKMEGLADGLQETLATGAAVGPFAELLERSGVNLDTFNAGLAEAAANGTKQQYALQQLADLGLSKVNEEYRANNQALIDNANAQYDVQAAMADLGDTILPIVAEITQAIGDLIGWFNSLDSGTQKVLLTIAGIAAVVGPVILIIGKLVTAVSAISAAWTAVSGAITAAGGIMAVITGPIGIAIAAIAGIIAAAVLIYKNWGPIKGFFIDLWDGISSATSTAWESIKGFFSGLWDWMQNFFAEWGTVILAVVAPFIGIPLLIYQHWDEIKKFMSEIWDAVASYLSGVWDGISSAASSVFSGMANLIRPIFEGIKTFFSGIWESIKNVFAGAVLLIVDLVTGDFKSLSKDAQAIWNNLKEAFAKIWDGIKQVFTGAVNLITSTLSAAWDGISTAASSAWNGIKSAISTIVSATTGWIKGQWNEMLTFFRELPGKLYTIGTDMFTRMRDAITTTVATVKDAIVSGLDTAMDWLRGLPADMLKIGGDIIHGLVNGIKNAMGAVGDAVKGIADKVTGGIRNLLDINSPSRVMMGLGEYTGEGFAKGIGNTLASVRDRAADMAAAASDALTGVTSPGLSGMAVVGAGAPVATNNVFFDGMFRGATFNAQDDNDLLKIGQAVKSALREVGLG